MKNRCEFLNVLTLLSLLLFFCPAAYAQANDGCDKRGEQSVILYDQPDFRGNQRYYGIGTCRLFNFNDQASSIKVPKGLVVVVYEHADEGGGFGEWVDFLEDQPDLSRYRFDKKISYVEVFATRRGSEGYERNKFENGRVVEGHWIIRKENPVNPDPVVAPFKPPNMPEITSFEPKLTTILKGQSVRLSWRTANAERVSLGERDPGVAHSADPIREQRDVDPSGASPITVTPERDTTYVLRAEKGNQSSSKIVTVLVGPAPPTFCSITGSISGDRLLYATRVELHRTDASQPVRVVRAIGGTFTFERVPVGEYQIVPKARFPPVNDHPSSLWFFPRAKTVTCRPNVPYRLVFRIGSTEG
jgi:hypothetical protein